MVYRILALFVLLVGGMGCSDGATQGSEQPANEVREAGMLTAEQLENGIGPISSVTLTAFDSELAKQGEEIFNTKCATCHKFDQRYVGPSLAGLLDHRTPAFVMNMMLNPAEMVEKHPEVKKMLAEFLTPMPNQNVTEEDARAILEYLREATQVAG